MQQLASGALKGGGGKGVLRENGADAIMAEVLVAEVK